jgi:hypothetical protein
VPEHRPPGRVPEVDALEPHAPGDARRPQRVGGALHLERRVQHLEHAARGDQALLEGVEDPRHARHLPRELLQEAAVGIRQRVDAVDAVEGEDVAGLQQRMPIQRGQRRSAGPKRLTPEQRLPLVR